MKKIAKQTKLLAVLLVAFVLMASMAVFALATDGADASQPARRGVSSDLVGVKWVAEGTETPSDSFVYTGEEIKIVPTNLPTGMTASSVTGNTATDVGEYTASCVLTYNTASGTSELLVTYDWSVTKAAYDMSGIVFADKTVSYNGLNQSIAIEGELPEGVTVTYEGSYKEVGTYTITANFVGDTANYEPIPSMTATLNIVETTLEDRTYVVKDSSGNIVIEVVSANGIPADKINAVENSFLYGNIQMSNCYSMKVLFSYDIGFSSEGYVQAIEGDFDVKILIPEDLRDNEKLELVYINELGEIERIGAVRDGNYFVFRTTHFSTYAMVEGFSTITYEEEGLPWWCILLIVIAVVAILFLLFALVAKRKPEPEEPSELDEPEDTPEDSEPEAQAETAPDAEEPATESPIEEQVEAPAEEPAEAPAEEPAEAPAEEVAPVAAPVSDDEDEAVGSRIIDGQVVMVRYRSSFMSRLIQSETDLQDYYTVLKNTLLSYKGVKARTSWNYESFNKGRIQCAKLNIKGRTLVLYLALAPDDYNASKYHFSNVSGKGKFDKVPMMLKIRSDRALKYAVELIDEVMKAHEIEAGEVPNVDYHMPYESTEALAQKDLVKIILPSGVTLGENSNLVKLDVSELIDGAPDEK